ncbi:hypothetical protein H2O64_03795 [Kordia sp. YSTF-M3]|uniref:YbjN domain-containing protein n=2 Tax=Kordia aestuariivivens TaxID=2759037 RepID=A0ABR7Q5I5_9FLAO|nr:hypothetical protein [Kordia aestuariivivens]
MNNTTLGELLTKQADTIQGQAGNWRFAVNDKIFICLTDEKNNRMRIISPITEVSNVDEKILKNCLTANFHTALDVKYAISDGILWSVFIHPLKELSEAQITDAVAQVYNANYTFGTIYSSTNLSFPGAIGQEKEKQKEQKLPKQKI